MFKRFFANCGEIAVRVIGFSREMGREIGVTIYKRIIIWK
jgi:acetyl/propionyl-CoA carboxylase alpha subunit